MNSDYGIDLLNSFNPVKKENRRIKEKFFLISIIGALLLLFCNCVSTYKVQTELVDMGEYKINTEFEKLELEKINYEICEKDKLCLDKQNAINLAENNTRTQNYITYLKELYKNDINTCNSFINRSKK